MKCRPLVLAAALLGAMRCFAQTPPLGAEFQANTYATGYQGNPAIASDGHGAFVIVWNSAGQDGDVHGIFGQRYDSTGTRVNPEFPVNTYTTSAQFSERVAMSGSGKFVVVWTSLLQDGDGTGVFGQRFEADGSRIGSEFRVNTSTTGTQDEPAIAINDDGSFVAVWSADQDGSGRAVVGQRFSASGAKVGSEFVANTYTTGNQHEPVVASAGAGNFVVVWDSNDQDGSDEGIFGQLFDGAGHRIGGEFPVNSFTPSAQAFPAVAMDRRGNFVVVWNSLGADLSDYGVSLQRFNSATERITSPYGELVANAFTTGSQGNPSVELDPDGRFLVVWQSALQDGSGSGIFASRFDRLGRIGSEFQVNVVTTGSQTNPRVAYDGSGFVVAWDGPGEDFSDYAVVARRQEFLPVRLLVDVQGNGSSNLNGVIEPGEAVRVQPVWANNATTEAELDGNIPDGGFGGPPGPNYQLLDATGGYGSVVPNSQAICEDGKHCYAVQLGGTRPDVHWDATLEEHLSVGGAQVWRLHVGNSFTDVPPSEPFYKKIETLLHYGITSGCVGTQYCPGDSVLRDQMAIFIAKGIAGAGELVPTTGTVASAAYNCSAGGHSLFSDVLPTDSACRHVHYMAAQNVTLGCGTGMYCPSQTITRDAMASFIAKAIVAPGGGNAVPTTYGPDPTTGRSYSCAPGSPNVHFSDVPVSQPFCKHIHFLWAKGIVDGCSPTTYCPGGSVQRDAMAKFIANGFNLQLYGP